MICPKCHESFKLEPWQIDDGFCKDGWFYCIVCIMEDNCGCQAHESLDWPVEAIDEPITKATA